MKNSILFFFVISQIGFSQTDTVLRKKISIGLSTSYGYGYRKLKQNKTSDDNLVPIVIKLRNDNEVKQVYQSIGINFNYYFKNKISFGFDINYNIFNYNTKVEYLSPIVNEPSIPLKTQTFYQFETVEIPLYIGYNLKIKKFNLFANFGIGTHYIYQAKLTYQYWYKDGTTINIGDKNYQTNFDSSSNEIFWSINSKIGIAYNPIKILGIRLSPELKYGITPLNNDPIQTKLIGYGINLSLTICL